MKLLRTTALTAALMTAAVPLLTSSAQAWRGGWRGAGWGWRGAGVGLAAGALVGGALAARNYGYGYPAYGYGYGTGTGYGYAPAYSSSYGTDYGYAPTYSSGYGTGYGYAPAYSSSYGTGYTYPAYGAYRPAYHPYVRRHIYAAAYGVRRYHYSH